MKTILTEGRSVFIRAGSRVRLPWFSRKWTMHLNEDMEDGRTVVAREAYGLTHEFVKNRLWEEFLTGQDFRNSSMHGNRRVILLDLDRSMKAFAKKAEDDATRS